MNGGEWVSSSIAKKCSALDLIGEEMQVHVDISLFVSIEIAGVSVVAISRMVV